MSELVTLIGVAVTGVLSSFGFYQIGKMKGNLIQNEHLAKLLFKALDNQEIYKEKNILAEELIKREDEMKEIRAQYQALYIEKDRLRVTLNREESFKKKYLTEEEAA
jgi:hypothetical protein